MTDVSYVDAAVRHAHELLRSHAENYVKEIVVDPLAWRRRYDELRQDLEWLEFVRKHPLTRENPGLPTPPPPPLIK